MGVVNIFPTTQSSFLQLEESTTELVVRRDMPKHFPLRGRGVLW